MAPCCCPCSFTRKIVPASADSIARACKPHQSTHLIISSDPTFSVSSVGPSRRAQFVPTCFQAFENEYSGTHHISNKNARVALMAALRTSFRLRVNARYCCGFLVQSSMHRFGRPGENWLNATQTSSGHRFRIEQAGTTRGDRAKCQRNVSCRQLCISGSAPALQAFSWSQL